MSALLLGRCFDLLVHPVDDIPFVPDDGLPAKLDLLWEGPVVDVGIDEGLTHTRQLKNLRQADHSYRSMSTKEVGWSSPHRPT